MLSRRTRRQRLILALLLLTGAALFTWARTFLGDAGETVMAYSPFANYGLPTQEPPPYYYFAQDSYQYEPKEPVAPFPLIGLGDIIFTPPLPPREPTTVNRISLTEDYIQRLMSFDYLTHNIFLVDRYTALFPSDIDVPAFLREDLRLNMDAPGPHVLIFHTHSLEMFVDSNPLDIMDGVVGVGRVLAEILTNVYGIETMHYTGQFDVVNGVPQRRGSYERMEPVITQLLADNPSIQMVIDLHRDGVRQGAGPFVTYIDGQRTARIMFFNGLSRQNRNGQITNVPWLPNPFQRENLNLSFQLQLAANELFPGLARRAYLREFRYSLHMAPMSMFVEVGNQYNTLQDAKLAMGPLAEIIAAVKLGGPPA